MQRRCFVPITIEAVIQTIRNEEFGDYWTETETYGSLKHYIGLNQDGLKDYVGEVALVGINYNKQDKKHECVIERFGGTWI